MAPPVNQPHCPADVTVQNVTKETDVTGVWKGFKEMVARNVLLVSREMNANDVLKDSREMNVNFALRISREMNAIPALTVTMVKHVVSMRLSTKIR